MRSESKHIIECMLSKIDKVADIHKINSHVLDGNPSKLADTTEIAFEILAVQQSLTSLSKLFK